MPFVKILGVSSLAVRVDGCGMHVSHPVGGKPESDGSVPGIRRHTGGLGLAGKPAFEGTFAGTRQPRNADIFG